TSLNGKGVLDEHHALSLGSNLRLSSVREHARNADVLLVIGAKLGDAELWVDRLDAQGTVIRIDIIDTQIDKNQPADLGPGGDAEAIVTAVAGLIGELAAPEEVSIADSEATVVELLEAARRECWEVSSGSNRDTVEVACDM